MQQAVGEPAVDAPASRARVPSTSMANRSSAASSFSPPRLTNRAVGPSTTDRSAGCTDARRLVGRRTGHGDPSGGDRSPGPAPGSAQALGGRARRRAVGAWLPLLRARRLLRRRLPGRRLLGGRLSGRRFLRRCLRQLVDPAIEALDVVLGGDAERGAPATSAPHARGRAGPRCSSGCGRRGRRPPSVALLSHLTRLHEVPHELFGTLARRLAEGDPDVEVALPLVGHGPPGYPAPPCASKSSHTRDYPAYLS